MTDRKPFTATRFADLGNQGMTRESMRGKFWSDEADLAHEAHETTGLLTIQDWRVIVSAITSGLPVILKTRHANRNGDPVMETMTATAMIDSLLSLDRWATIRHRRWGFCNPIYLTDIVSVEAPATEYDWQYDL